MQCLCLHQAETSHQSEFASVYSYFFGRIKYHYEYNSSGNHHLVAIPAAQTSRPCLARLFIPDGNASALKPRFPQSMFGAGLYLIPSVSYDPNKFPFNDMEKIKFYVP